MPKRKEPMLTPEAQHARFIQAVRDMEAAGDLRDYADERFERTLAHTNVKPTVDDAPDS